MPKNRDAFIRYRVINACLKNKQHKFPSKDDLREKCMEALGVSDLSFRTIEKDIFDMRFDEELGFIAPIKYVPRMKGYMYEDEQYSIDNIPINDQDLDALYFASTILENYKNVSILQDFKGAVEKLNEAINIHKSAKKQELDFIHFEKADYIPGGEYLSTLVKAVHERKKVTFTYQKFNADTSKTYVFEPFSLKEYLSLWYVIGWVEEYQEVRTFALDRITSLEMLYDTQEKRETFENKRFFDNVLGISRPDDEKQKVVLQFTTLQGKYIKTSPIHHTQKIIKNESDEFVIELTLIPNHELMMKILSYGANVKVIEPVSLKNDVLNYLQKSIDNYQS